MSPARSGRRRPVPATGQAVWTAVELTPADWMIPLGAEDAAELAAALDALAAAAPEPPMPRCAALFATLRTRLADGRGFALLRGLAPESAPGGAAALIGLLARHIGLAPPDAGTEPLAAEPAPGYESGDGLLALLCLRASGTGAPVTLVSAGGLHNAMLLRDRALLGELYEPLPVADPAGLSAEPIFRHSVEGFSARFAPERIATAEDEPHHAKVNGRQRAALAMLTNLAESAEQMLKLEMRAGDLLCLDARRIWLRRFARATEGEAAFLLAPL